METPAALASAKAALERGAYDEARALAVAAVRADNDLRPDAERLVALSYFRAGDYPRAQAAYAEVTARIPLPQDEFNLASAATLAGDLEAGRAAFDRAVAGNEQHATMDAMTTPQMTFFYAHALRDAGAPARAAEQVARLASTYAALTITDAHFLHLRGVPAFGRFLALAAEVLPHAPDGQGDRVLTDLRARVDEEGGAAIDAV